MSDHFHALAIRQAIDPVSFAVTRQTIRDFCDGSLDYNPLHLDDDYMKGDFGRTNFGGVIMHGMTNFGVLTRMLTDWLYARDGMHRRLETRWLKPVKPGDTITASGAIKAKKTTEAGCWVTIDVQIRNQRDELIATGEAMAEFPDART